MFLCAEILTWLSYYRRLIFFWVIVIFVIYTIWKSMVKMYIICPHTLATYQSNDWDPTMLRYTVRVKWYPWFYSCFIGLHMNFDIFISIPVQVYLDCPNFDLYLPINSLLGSYYIKNCMNDYFVQFFNNSVPYNSTNLKMPACGKSITIFVLLSIQVHYN